MLQKNCDYKWEISIVRQQAVKKKHQIALIIGLRMAELFFFHYEVTVQVLNLYLIKSMFVPFSSNQLNSWKYKALILQAEFYSYIGCF